LTVLDAEQFLAQPLGAAYSGVRHSRAQITSAGIWRANCE
jgi:hypothetical protein